MGWAASWWRALWGLTLPTGQRWPGQHPRPQPRTRRNIFLRRARLGSRWELFGRRLSLPAFFGGGGAGGSGDCPGVRGQLAAATPTVTQEISEQDPGGGPQRQRGRAGAAGHGVPSRGCGDQPYLQETRPAGLVRSKSGSCEHIGVYFLIVKVKLGPRAAPD